MMTSSSYSGINKAPLRATVLHGQILKSKGRSETKVISFFFIERKGDIVNPL